MTEATGQDRRVAARATSGWTDGNQPSARGGRHSITLSLIGRLALTRVNLVCCLRATRLGNGGPMSAIEQTFDPVDMFCRYLTPLGRADGTVDLYRNAITLTQRHLGAGTDLLAASGAELKRVYMLSDWAATLAPQTKITYGRFVATYLEWAAHDAELIEQAPTAALRGYLGQIKPGQQGLPTFLPYAELERLD